MRSPRLSGLFIAFVAMPVLLVSITAKNKVLAADAPTTPPAAPPVSEFAPVDILADQVDPYVQKLEDSLATQDDYKDSTAKIAKDANTLIVIALALGVSDEDNAYRSSAAAMVKAAQAVAAAEDYAAAKAAVADLKAAAASKTGGADKLKWEKVASLAELMKAVPSINTKLKGALRREKRFKRKPKKPAGYATVLAVIAQGAMANASETDEPAEAEQWFRFCADMRGAAGEVAAACVEKDHAAAQAAFDRLDKTCHACHAVFHEEEL